MLPFRLVETPSPAGQSLPFYAYSVGRHQQHVCTRPEGFPAYQLFLVKSGQGVFRDLPSGEETLLSPGYAFLSLPDRGHEYYPTSHEPWHIGFVGFRGELASALLEQAGLLLPDAFPLADFEACWNGIGDLWAGVDEPGPGRLQDLSAKLYRLVLRLGNERTAAKESPARLRPEDVRNRALRQALLLMNQHYAEPLSISNLAGAVGYSPQHFQRLFLQHFYVTPNRYLQNLRLERARQLIAERGGLQIQEIARLVGMETNYFVRLFRRTFGKTPGSIRAEIEKGDAGRG